jgi:predicted transcriptional regulator
MARNPRTLDQAKTNLEGAVSKIPDRYRQGVETAEWSKYAASDQAEKNYAASMSSVLSEKRRQAGVKRVGDETWRNGALTKGATVIGSRIRDSLDKWAERFGRVYEPVRRKLATLPEPGLDAMENIDKRLKPVVKAWQENKLKGKG